MQRLEVSGAVRHVYMSLGFKGLTDFRKIVQNQILQTTVQWEPSCSMRTDRRRDMTKLIFTFHNFANAPNYNIFYIVIHIGPHREHNLHTCQRPAGECYMVIKASFAFRITTIHADELCGNNAEILVLKFVVRIVTTRLLRHKHRRVGPGSIVVTATAYGLDGPGIDSRWWRDFPHLSRPALWPTQPPVKWVPGLYRGKVRPGRDADPSTPPSAEVKK
jgi:hypothetical protein